MRNLFLLALLCGCGSALAGTINVTSPNSGDFLGKTNSVSFNITGAVAQVKITVTATLDSNPAINVQVVRQFTPNVEGEIDSSVPLNFSESTPEGAYTLTVVATEPGATYNSVPPIPVTIDVKDPKFGDSNPLTGAFVKGIVPIVVDLVESFVDEWRVRINGSDIPNNSGSTNQVVVNWDSNTVIIDGEQTINISVEDLANNTATKDISVTVDRINPSSTILAPSSGAIIRPESRIAVVVDVNDQFTNSVHFTGIDVRLKTLGDVDLGPVPRRNVKTVGNKISWTGRIRSISSLPNSFKIVVTAIDRAGNVAVVQEVTVTVSGSRDRNTRVKRGRQRGDGKTVRKGRGRGNGLF